MGLLWLCVPWFAFPRYHLTLHREDMTLARYELQIPNIERGYERLCLACSIKGDNNGFQKQ